MYLNSTGKEPDMVATRGTNQTVAFITGKEKRRINPAEITNSQWAEILRSAIDDLPANYLRGFQSIRQILHYDGHYGIHRIVSSGELVMGSLPDMPSRELRGNEVFLNCADIGYNQFPWGQLVHQEWTRAPRTQTENGKRGALADIVTGNILLSRDKRLYYLEATWSPQEKWDDLSLSQEPECFWYETGPLKIGMGELDDQSLGKCLERIVGDDGRMLLRRFLLALEQTADNVLGQHRRLVSTKQTMEGYLNRIG